MSGRTSTTEQLCRVPAQPADQRTKREPRAALAVSFTTVPSGRVALQRAPQRIPVPVTVPRPVPALRTVSLTFGFGMGTVVVGTVVVVGGPVVTSTAIGCVRTSPLELPLTVTA